MSWGRAKVLVVVLSGVSSVAGCGDSSANSATAPTASVAAPAWSGGAEQSQKMLGLWVAGVGDTDVRGEKAERMQRGLAECTFKFDFREQGKVFIHQGRDAEVEEGAWELVRGDERSMVVRIASPLFGAAGSAEFALEFLDENRFMMRQVGGIDALAFTLTRVRR